MNKPKKYDLVFVYGFNKVGIYFGFFKDEHYHLIYIKNRFRKLIQKKFYRI